LAFTRTAFFLKWDYTGVTPASKYAFYALKEDYGGGAQQKLAAYARSQFDNSLLITRAVTSPRRFVSQVFGLDDASGEAAVSDGVESISFGDIDNLKEAWAATDLQCKSFEDSAYWEAEWMGDWTLAMELDPLRNYAIVLMTLEGKA